jgi:hypothetical protein
VTSDQATLLVVGVLGVVCVALVVALVRIGRGASRVRGELDAVQRRLEDLEGRQQELTSPVATRASEPAEFVITDLGREVAPVEPVHLDAPAFADIVLKETVVKAASLAHGVRRGLSPANRNRIRFEMRMEVRRARKQRRADLKAAQRDLRRRQRAELAADDREAS